MKFKHALPFILTALLVVLAACQSPEATPEPFPTGKFAATSDPGMGYEFNADGTFGYFFGGTEPVVTGTYTIAGNRLTLVDPEEVDPLCQGETNYEWSFDGTNLTFVPTAEDTCRPRADSFAVTYKRSE